MPMGVRASPVCPRSPRRPASWMQAGAPASSSRRSGGAGCGELHLGPVVAAFVDVADRLVLGPGLADGELAGAVDVTEAVEVGRRATGAFVQPDAVLTGDAVDV